MNIPLISKFPVSVLILKKSGEQGGLICSKDKARYFERNGRWYYELKKRHTRFEPPTYEYMLPTSKGKQMIILFEYGRKMFKPISAIAEPKLINEYFQGKPMDFGKLDAAVANFKIPEEDMSLWASMARRQVEDKIRKKSGWDKMFPFITMALFFVLAIILFYLFTNGVTQQVGSINSGLQAVAQRLGGVVVTPPPP